jgi:hypothetical protein
MQPKKEPNYIQDDWGSYDPDKQMFYESWPLWLQAVLLPIVYSPILALISVVIIDLRRSINGQPWLFY